MAAYKPEDLNKVKRTSMDVPVNFEDWKKVVAETPIIVIYMWSEGCRPCHLIRDKYESLASQLQNEDVQFYKDNIDLPTSFHKEQVDVVPTFFIICDGQEMNHPVHKSRYNGWSPAIAESSEFFTRQSRRLQHNQLMRQKKYQQQHQSPRYVCKNNVCYIRGDGEEEEEEHC
jgi:thiol-disulfide isomerase/thioredoxin